MLKEILGLYGTYLLQETCFNSINLLKLWNENSCLIEIVSCKFFAKVN